MIRAHLLAALAGAGLVLAPSPASAVPTEDTSITFVESTRRAMQILVSVPPDVEVAMDELAVTIDGEDAEATAERAATTTTVKRTAVLVIDTSRSMAGSRFEAAKAAATTFLDTVPDDVHVGIVSFDGETSEDLAPTLDRDAARDVVDGLSLDSRTRLYDGVQVALDMAGPEGQRQLLVLSDGADTSNTTLAATTDAILSSRVQVDVVGLEQDGPALEALEGLSAAGEGSLINADSGALKRTFAEQADLLARQVLVSATVPETVEATSGTVSIALGSDAGTLSAETYTRILKPRPEPQDDPLQVVPVDRGRVLGTPWLLAGVAALGLGFLAVLMLFVPRRQQPMRGAELAMSYTKHVSVGAHRLESSAGRPGQVTEAAEKVLNANSTLESRIADRLEGAGNPFKPAEWVLVHLAVFLGAGALGTLLGGGSIALGILFLVLGAVGPWFFLGFKRTRRRKAFETSLPDTLQLMSGSLAAGLSLAQSVDTIVREGQDPIASELRRVLIETRLGINLDDALEGVSDRFRSKDFAWVVMAIRIQRQVGGNLAELLDTVAATIRERDYMGRQVSALAAEGKLSAWVLGGLPPVFLVYLVLAKRDYVMPMFTDPRGWVMLAGGGLLLGLGVFWMSRLIKVEV